MRESIGQLNRHKRTYFLAHPGVDNLVFALDALWTTGNTPVDTAGDNDLLLGLLGSGSSTAEELGDLSGLFAVVEIFRLHDTVCLPLGLFEALVLLELFAPLGFGNLLDWPSVEGTLTVAERLHSFLRDWNVGAVVFRFVIEEPAGEAALVEGELAVETLVNELISGDLTVNEAGGEGDGLGSGETLGYLLACPLNSTYS